MSTGVAIRIVFDHNTLLRLKCNYIGLNGSRAAAVADIRRTTLTFSLVLLALFSVGNREARSEQSGRLEMSSRIERAGNRVGLHLKERIALDQRGPITSEAAKAETTRWWPFSLLVVYCILIVLASLGGGWLPILMNLTHTRMQLMLSFVGGLMLGIGLFHMLPHAFHELQSLDRAVWWMMVGLVTMFFLVRIFHFHQHGAVDLPHVAGEVIREPSEAEADQHACDHEHHHHGHHHGQSHKLGWIGIALGLSLHTMIDGIALAASVKADAGHSDGLVLFGLGTFLAVALHKPLDSVSITSLMMSSGWSAGWRHAVNGGFALMCPLGAFVFVAGVEQFAAYQHVIVGCALALAAGVFLCISLSDLLPEMELHSHNRIQLSLALIAGIALAWGIRFLEPQHLHSHTGASTAVEVSAPHVPKN